MCQKPDRKRGQGLVPLMATIRLRKILQVSQLFVT